MSFKYIEEDSSDYGDSMVIAILNREDIKLTFIMIDDELATAEYDCLAWHDTEMLIGIASSYLHEVIDESVAAEIERKLSFLQNNFEIMPEDVDRKMLQDLSAQVLSEHLKEVAAAVMINEDPANSSIDLALSRILDEH